MVYGMANRAELMPGTLDMLILKTLTRAPLHGYGIAQSIKRVSDGVLTVEEGSLYPALQRLLLQGWVKAEWPWCCWRALGYWLKASTGYCMWKPESTLRTWQRSTS
jgi:Transcriptional regulator PadR-like family